MASETREGDTQDRCLIMPPGQRQEHAVRLWYNMNNEDKLRNWERIIEVRDIITGHTVAASGGFSVKSGSFSVNQQCFINEINSKFLMNSSHRISTILKGGSNGLLALRLTEILQEICSPCIHQKLSVSWIYYMYHTHCYKYICMQVWLIKQKSKTFRKLGGVIFHPIF